jgi:hypothetical protein
VTRAGLREYAAVQRERYLGARRADKHRLLNEVVAVTGLHRKAAIRLLRRPRRPPGGRPRSGRPRVYGPAVAAAAQLLSEATGHIGPHRWHLSLPFNPSRCSEDRLRPFVRSTGPWFRGTPNVHYRGPCGVSDARPRKTQADRTDRPTGEFRVAGTPQAGAYAASRL